MKKAGPVPELESVEDIAPDLSAARLKLAATLQKVKPEELTDRLRGNVGLYVDDPGRRSPSSLSAKSKRMIRFLIHERFTQLGIAPAWRGDVRVPWKKKGTPLTAEEQRHRNDGQIIDLHWIHHTLPGHGINIGIAGEFEDLFQGEFIYRKAERFATSSLLYETKVAAVNLSPLQEAQLIALRSDAVRAKVKDVQDTSHHVRADLVRALDNPHRLKSRDRDEVARDMTNGWMSFALASGSPITAARVFKVVTGVEQTRAQMKTRGDAIRSTLEEIGSKYAAAVLQEKGKRPWHRAVITRGP